MAKPRTEYEPTKSQKLKLGKGISIMATRLSLGTRFEPPTTNHPLAKVPEGANVNAIFQGKKLMGVEHKGERLDLDKTLPAEIQGEGGEELVRVQWGEGKYYYFPKGMLLKPKE